MFADDDDFELSLSDARRFQSADRGKLKALELKLKAEGKETAAKPLSEQKSKLKLSVLKSEISGKQDEQTKKLRKKERPKGFGTKTLQQEIEQSRMDGSTKQNPDMLTDAANRADKAKDEQQKSGEVQSSPA